MTESDPSFFVRLVLAFGAFFRILFNASFAGRVQRLESGRASLPAPPPPVVQVAPVSRAPEQPKLLTANTDSALQLLGLLQRDGRLIDFLQEEVSGYSDAEIGAAARVVHGSVRKALLSHVTLERVKREAEGSRVTIAPGFSAHEVRLTGNVVGEAPFTGTLAHAGWRAINIELPKLSPGYDVRVLAPAEVEL
ncbi:MAG: hypothetical protein JWN48_3150 [Myxococcaceae bacterium]|nr:hypothetical protein [Myxococcaceae bacterium]